MIKNRMLQTKTFLGITALIFLGVVAGFVYSYLELVALERKYEAQLQLVANNAVQAQQADRLQQTLDQSTTDREKLDSYFLNVREVADLLAETEQYMQHIAVAGEVGSITPQPANDIGIATVAIPYSVAGTRTQVLQLLQFLETLPYHSAVTEFAMNGNPSSSRVEAQITVAVSYIEHD